MLRVVGLQTDIVWEDREVNLARYAPLVAKAAQGGGRLVLLPEMFAVGFSMRTDRTAEPADGPTTEWLSAHAVANALWVGGSIPEVAAGAERPANVFVLAGPDGTCHRYAKRHPFSHGEEADHFVAGDGVTTVEVDGVRCSLAVCYDLRFADQFWRQAPDTDAYLVVANWPTSRETHWRTLLTARAIENQAYVVGVNRIGAAGDGTAHSGASVILDPLGVVVAEGGAEAAAVVADLDPEVVRATRERFPFLADRR